MLLHRYISPLTVLLVLVLTLSACGDDCRDNPCGKPECMIECCGSTDCCSVDACAYPEICEPQCCHVDPCGNPERCPGGCPEAGPGLDSSRFLVEEVDNWLTEPTPDGGYT